MLMALLIGCRGTCAEPLSHYCSYRCPDFEDLKEAPEGPGGSGGGPVDYGYYAYGAYGYSYYGQGEEQYRRVWRCGDDIDYVRAGRGSRGTEFWFDHDTGRLIAARSFSLERYSWCTYANTSFGDLDVMSSCDLAARVVCRYPEDWCEVCSPAQDHLPEC